MSVRSSWLIAPLENGWIVMRGDCGGRAANGPRWCARSREELAALILDLIADEEPAADPRQIAVDGEIRGTGR